jgi:membrane fusion protein, multidrug efflux system
MTNSNIESESVPAGTKPRSRRWGWKLGASLFILGVVGFAVVRSRRAATATAASAAAENRPTPVQIVNVSTTDLPLVLEGLGNVLSLATVTVRSQVDGRLDRVAFKEGQTVRKGELLAQVDPRTFQIQLLNSQAALTRDTAQLNNARLNLDRYTTLRAQNLVSQQQVDDQRTLVSQTESAINADQASIQAAKLQLEFARIVSPITGVTGVRLVDQGNLVRASDPAGIVVVTQLDPIGVMFTLPEDNQFRINQALKKGPVAVEAYSRDGSTLLAKGQVLVLDNQINSTTATIRLKASFPNPDRKLWPNAFVKTKMTLETRRGVVGIPNAAIQQGPDGTFVYIVSPEQTAVVRHVEVDFIQRDTAVIAKGITPGEQVVVEGQGQLRPGAKVLIRTSSGKDSGTAADVNQRARPSEVPALSAAPADSSAPMPQRGIGGSPRADRGQGLSVPPGQGQTGDSPPLGQHRPDQRGHR